MNAGSATVFIGEDDAAKPHRAIEELEVDAAGIVRSASGSHELNVVAWCVGTQTSDELHALERAVKATIDIDGMPAALRSIHWYLHAGARRELDEVGLVPRFTVLAQEELRFEVSPPGVHAQVFSGAASGGCLYRAAFDDAVTLGDRSVAILHDRQLRRISERQASVWAAATGRTPVQISEVLNMPLSEVHFECVALEQRRFLAAEPSWRLNDAVAWTEDRFGVVFLVAAERGGRVLALSGTGAEVWRTSIALGQFAADRISAELASGYDLRDVDLSAEVETFYSSLATQGILVA